MAFVDDNLVNTAQAASYLGLREQTLRLLRCRGRGPRHERRDGPGRGRAHWYDLRELDRWQAERRRRTTRGRLDA